MELRQISDQYKKTKSVKKPQYQSNLYTGVYFLFYENGEVEFENIIYSYRITYDNLNRLAELVNQKTNGTIVLSYKYTLGAAGNRVKVEENNARIVEYTYDDLYRLTEENIYDQVEGSAIIGYTFDPVGNRL